MTLQEIFELLNKNIADNNGTLRLSPDMIPSPEIVAVFEEYLLNEDLVVSKAVATLEASRVTVEGEGSSFIFFGTAINALVFTTDAEGASMTVGADAIIKTTDGWTLGRSFPVLRHGNWDGFYNPGKPGEWIQYLFFREARFTLGAEGLAFRGILILDHFLDALASLFNINEVEVAGTISLNKGKEGYIVTTATVVPEMKLVGNIGVIDLSLGSFPAFTLSFSMNVTAFIITIDGADKGRPLPGTEILVETTLPIEQETIGAAMVVGTQSNALTMRAIMPDTFEVGISELIGLANNENLLALMPSNIPVIYDFVLKDWQMSFNTREKAVTMIALQVGTRAAFSWEIIPRYLTLKSVDLWFGMVYLNNTFSPNVTIEGTITLGNGPKAVNFTISASFPSYVFMGSLDPETPVDLREILVYLLGETIGQSLPDTLQLGVLDMTIDPKNSTYSLNTSLTTDLEIPVVLTTIIVRTIIFNINYVAGVGTGNITGEFQIGTGDKAPMVFVTAAYNGPSDGWLFSGGLKDGSSISIKDLIDTYLPAEYHDFNPFDITITSLVVTFTQGAIKTYKFKLGAEWKLDLGLGEPLVISGLTEISYIPTNATPYTGFVEGMLSLGNILVKARVDFKDKYNDYTFTLNNVFVARLTHNPEGDSIICFNFTAETSLGDMIAWLVGAATGEEITLPSPWNVMNNIKLKDFSFSFNLTKNRIGLTYRPSINLGFIDIKAISLFYTYYPNDPAKAPLVELEITDGSFLGGAMPLPGAWNVLDPQAAPAVPGQGESLFRLEFLGLGQHVSLKTGLSPNSVAQAVDMLKAGFGRSTALKPANPIEGTGLTFNSSSNWLIGTQFVLLDTFAIGIVFFDPDLYGLSLYVNGPKAQVFQGLKFEIMYKKVSDTVGVYQVYLKLPDSIRQIDFGTVSVTLPAVKIYIYTNGDFKIDFGFPVNDDFSESFGLQMLPFIGSGGFYFGLLSAETAETVPKATNGNFSPVIVFGVGLRVGIGKEINKGILKAGISIVVQGILEGTFAQFNYYDANRTDHPVYYYVLGKISIIGHVYGSVDFLIISAEVDLKVFVSARIVFQSYEPILISLSAGVSVSVKVRINLGLFSISIGMSFSTTIQESFTIGSPQPKPWITDSRYAAMFRRPALRALDSETCPVIPTMDWQPLIPESPVNLDILYIPQFTAATEGEGGQQPYAVAMLYLESPIDQPEPKKTRLPGGIAEEEDFAFVKFAKGVFLWALGAFFNKTGDKIPVATVMEQPVTIANLNEILCYFSQKDLTEPCSIQDIFGFLSGYFKATITVPPRNIEVVSETTVSVLPMLPNLVFSTPAGDVYFDERATYQYDQEQLALIHTYFNTLSVRYKDGDAAAAASLRGFAGAEEQSLATFMLIDYISLLAKEACQKGIDRMTSLELTVGPDDSIAAIAARYPGLGISVMELAYANRTRDLGQGLLLNLGELRYTIKEGDTAAVLGSRFNLTAAELHQANLYQRQAADPCRPTAQPRLLTGADGFIDPETLVPGATIRIPAQQYTTTASKGEADTLHHIAVRHGIDVMELIAANMEVPGLFPAGEKIVAPFVEALTVGELIAAMEVHHDFEQLSGLSANVMLQGLRVPLPESESAIGEPEALYKISGQQIEASALALGQNLSLTLPESLDWLSLGTAGGTELNYTLAQEDIDALQAIGQAELKPEIISFKASPMFAVQARKFTLPANITWQPAAGFRSGKAGGGAAAITDPSIWMFAANLQALLNGYDAIAPKVLLLKQVQETETRAAEPQPVTDYSWATKIDVRLVQVCSAEDPTKLMPNVYELQGTDQASMTLLQDLIAYCGANPDSGIISQIEVLYSKEPAREGQQAPPSGLKSDSPDNTMMYLLQTNLSTLSNPQSSQAVSLWTAATGTQSNLVGMSQLEFLKYVWEAAIVGTGGYYFYYQIQDSKAGLPEYLFNGDTDNIITLLVRYNSTGDVLHDFMNSVIVQEPVNIADEILYVETLPQNLSNVSLVAGESLQAFAQRHRASVSDIARQNRTTPFRENVRLQLPASLIKGTQEQHAGSADTLETVAERLGMSVVALAHANRHVPDLFDSPLSFDSRIEVKVATVPPGNIGFDMKRCNPENISGISPAALNLQQLYNLLGYNIAPNDDFVASVPGLPVAPGDNSYTPPTGPGNAVRPSALLAEDYQYNRIVPVYRFAKAELGEMPEGDVPAEQENPYRAVGKTVALAMRWQDIFGNLTGFTATGNPVVLPPQKVGYTDPVIGLSMYPSIAASYIIALTAEETPALYITLAFNPSPYVPVKAGDEAWRRRVSSDREAYRQIYYQLLQQDMKVSVTNTLAGDALPGRGVDTVKPVLTDLVLTLFQYLGLLETTEQAYTFYTVPSSGATLDEVAAAYDTTPEQIRRINPDIPADGILQPGTTVIISAVDIPEDALLTTPLSDENPESLFALVTKLTLTRDPELVADDFKDEPSVTGATSVLGPNLRKEGATGSTAVITIQEFAQKLEAAFPGLKTASGTPQTGVQNDSAIDLWVARFSDTGIRFAITNSGKPFYFALKPLSTHLISREDVKIYPYVTGTPIMDMPSVSSAFNGADMEQLAQTCLAAIDTFLGADYAIPAWQVEQAPGSQANGNTIPYPYQSVISAKKKLAGNIVKHIATVLEEENTPGAGNKANAQERLRQELLISLSNAYSIDTIVQFNVSVQSPYTDANVPAPQLFGKVIDPNNTTQDDQMAYAFSTTRFSLEQSGGTEDASSYLTILFNTKKDHELQLENGYFPISLQYEINSLEHDIRNVPGIQDYKASSWLTFILPFGNGQTGLGNLKIPVPLRAYPTAPSLTAQSFSTPESMPGAVGEMDKLAAAKLWNYHYTYDYLRAQQDTINTDIVLNVPAVTQRMRQFADDEAPDLFAALLQFSSAYPGIQRDFSLYLMDQSDLTNAYTAMQSFAWLVDRVADAWGRWNEDQHYYSNARVAGANYQYQVTEGAIEIDGQQALQVNVIPQSGTAFRLPVISITGFETQVLEDTPQLRRFAYYSGDAAAPAYLSPAQGRAIPQRHIGFEQFNIVEQENVWSGISVIRNKILVPGVPTSPDFIYTTPAIRFVSVLTPLLNPDILIDIARYTQGSGKQPIAMYLSNFFQALFSELKEQETWRQISVNVGYSYNLIAGEDSLRTFIPISITTPFSFAIPGSWETGSCPANPDDVTPESPFVCQLAALIGKWFSLNNPVTTDARLNLDLSLFSGLSDTKLPVLRLRNVYLDEKDIQWS